MQKQPWVRLYRNSLHNPKLVTLGERAHLTWYRLLSIADDDGNLPQIRYIAADLRMSVQDAELILADLVGAGLVDASYGNGPISFRMHDWDEHQYKSDSSAERTRKYRNKINGNSENSEQKAETVTQRNVTVTAMKRHGDGDVTPPESESDTDTDYKPKVLSSRTAAREEKEPKGFIGDLKKTKTNELYVRRAEGLGLDVEDIARLTRKYGKQKPAAYFTKICVDRLQEVYPTLEEGVIRDALWEQDGKAFALVSQVLMVSP